MVTTLEMNRFCTLHCVDLMYSSKYRYLCVLSFDIKFVFSDITIATLSATKVRFLKKSRDLFAKQGWVSPRYKSVMLFYIYTWAYRGGPILWLFLTTGTYLKTSRPHLPSPVPGDLLKPLVNLQFIALCSREIALLSWTTLFFPLFFPLLFKGGLYPKTNEIVTNICSCHNFFPLSSVQIIIIPACCLLCVL